MRLCAFRVEPWYIDFFFEKEEKEEPINGRPPDFKTAEMRSLSLPPPNGNTSLRDFRTCRFSSKVKLYNHKGCIVFRIGGKIAG